MGGDGLGLLELLALDVAQGSCHPDLVKLGRELVEVHAPPHRKSLMRSIARLALHPVGGFHVRPVLDVHDPDQVLGADGLVLHHQHLAHLELLATGRAEADLHDPVAEDPSYTPAFVPKI